MLFLLLHPCGDKDHFQRMIMIKLKNRYLHFHLFHDPFFRNFSVCSGGRLFDAFVSSLIICRKHRYKVQKYIESGVADDQSIPVEISQSMFDRFGAKFRRYLIASSSNELKTMKFEHTLFFHMRGMSRSALSAIAASDGSFMKLRQFDTLKMNAIADVTEQTR